MYVASRRMYGLPGLGVCWVFGARHLCQLLGIKLLQKPIHMSGVGAPAVRPRIRLEATTPLGPLYVWDVWGWGPSYVSPNHGRYG
eukprot:gene20214-biopygen17566